MRFTGSLRLHFTFALDARLRLHARCYALADTQFATYSSRIPHTPHYSLCRYICPLITTLPVPSFTHDCLVVQFCLPHLHFTRTPHCWVTHGFPHCSYVGSQLYRFGLFPQFDFTHTVASWFCILHFTFYGYRTQDVCVYAHFAVVPTTYAHYTTPHAVPVAGYGHTVPTHCLPPTTLPVTFAGCGYVTYCVCHVRSHFVHVVHPATHTRVTCLLVTHLVTGCGTHAHLYIWVTHTRAYAFTHRYPVTVHILRVYVTPRLVGCHICP